MFFVMGWYCIVNSITRGRGFVGASTGPAPRQAGLGIHRDGTLLNAVVLLSDETDFEGGGTLFAPPLDRTYKLSRGDCLCSSGQLRHGAADVVRGTRVVLVAFIDEAQPAIEAPPLELAAARFAEDDAEEEEDEGSGPEEEVS